MRAGWYLESGAVLLLACSIGAGSALAQSAGRPWVDPPANLDATPSQPPGQTAPAPVPTQPVRPNPPQQAAQPDVAAPPGDMTPARPTVAAKPKDPHEARLAARAEAARNLAIGYLDSWSSPNREALEASDDFYADRVVFHGRAMSVRSLVREKRRFAQRWPKRDYRPKHDTIKVACEPSGTFCTVHSIFDFTAANSRRKRLAQGVGALQLVVGFLDERPIITAENSLVLGQSRGRRNVALENSSDD